MVLTKEREAEIRAQLCPCDDNCCRIPNELLAALDAERAAHEETKRERDRLFIENGKWQDIPSFEYWKERAGKAESELKCALIGEDRFDTLLACVKECVGALESISGVDELFEKTEFEICGCEEADAYMQMNKRRRYAGKDAIASVRKRCLDQEIEL